MLANWIADWSRGNNNKIAVCPVNLMSLYTCHIEAHISDTLAGPSTLLFGHG